MTDAERLRAVARAQAEAEEGALASHPEPATLLAYQLRQLPSEEAELLRDHLVLCADCSHLVLQIESFPDLFPLPADRLLSDRQQAAEWALLRDRIEPTAVAPAAAPSTPRPPHSRFPLPWALAASLLLATTLGLGVSVHRLLGRFDALAGPQVNLAVADLDPEGSGPREGPSAEPAEVRLTASTDRMLLILNLTDWRPFATYRLRMTGAAGQVVWESGDLVRSDQGNFLLTFPRALLPVGTYRLRLNGRTSEGKQQQLAEYSLRIAGP